MEGGRDPGRDQSGTARALAVDAGIGLAAAAAAIGVRLSFEPWIENRLPYGAVMLAVAIVALWRGWRPAVVCMATGAPTAVYLFVRPMWSLRIPDFNDRISLLSFLIIASTLLVVADASYRMRRRAHRTAAAAVRAEVALRESEERYRRLVELSPDAIFVTVDRRIVYVNAAMVKLFGAGSAADLEGRAVLDLVHPESRSLVNERVVTLHDSGRPNPPAEEKWVRPDGVVLMCEVVAAPTQWTGAPGVQVILRDIRERKAAEDQLAQQARALARSNTDLEDFAYVVSHDLKEPLRGIANFAGFVLEDAGPKLDGDDKDKLHTLVRLSHRMLSLLDSLLEYSRVGRAQMAVAENDLGQLAARAVETLSPWLSEQGAEVRVNGPLPRVRCDAVRVEQVFTNLITNGVKYNDRAERRVEIGATENGRGSPAFYVKDNGIGVPERHRTLIFKMFRRLHARDRYGGGTGSGLAIVKAIVERHGGRIWMEGVPGEGSTFWFTLGSDGRGA